MPGENMIYNTGTISINGNTATGTGTNWTAPASQVRAGQTIIVMSNPVQMFQITAINSGTSLTVTPAASPALSGQTYGILVTDSLSVDGLAQSMSQIINEYGENIGAWATFASISANQLVTVTINGTSFSIPAIGGLARKGANSDITELKGLTTPLSLEQGGLGANNAADALANLRLGAGTPAIGIPFFWPSAAMPNTVMPEWSDMVFLKFNNSTFSAATYPKLALVIPSLTLPDARGEFPRIWDDARGVDSGRAILSAQSDAIRNITGSVGFTADGIFTYSSGAFSLGTQASNNVIPAGTTGAKARANFDASNVVPTASENRPRNIAFNFLVRAK